GHVAAWVEILVICCLGSLADFFGEDRHPLRPRVPLDAPAIVLLIPFAENQVDRAMGQTEAIVHDWYSFCQGIVGVLQPFGDGEAICVGTLEIISCRR